MVNEGMSNGSSMVTLWATMLHKHCLGATACSTRLHAMHMRAHLVLLVGFLFMPLIVWGSYVCVFVRECWQKCWDVCWGLLLPVLEGWHDPPGLTNRKTWYCVCKGVVILKEMNFSKFVNDPCRWGLWIKRLILTDESVDRYVCKSGTLLPMSSSASKTSWAFILLRFANSA